MHYDPIYGPIVAKRWKVPTSTLTRWKRQGIIPDYRALNEPLSKKELAIEEKLIRLIESGWLKGRPIGRMISSGDKINSLLTARRHPNDSRYHVRHLNASEIKQVKSLLDKLQRSIGMLLYLASLTPDGQLHNDVVQADLRALLRREYISGVGLRQGMNKRQIARFWTFLRGSNASCEDTDFTLGKLHLLASLLS